MTFLELLYVILSFLNCASQVTFEKFAIVFSITHISRRLTWSDAEPRMCCPATQIEFKRAWQVQSLGK